MRFFSTLLILCLYCTSYSQVNENNGQPASNSIPENNKIPDSLIISEDNDIEEIEEDEIELEELKVTRKKEKNRKDLLNKKKGNTISKGKVSSESGSSKIIKVKSRSFNDANQKLYLNKKISRQQTYQRNPTIEQQQQMQDANDVILNEDPYSFEYNLNKYVIGNYNTQNYSNLESAEKINPNSTELIKQMAAHNIIVENEKQSQVYLNKLKEKNQLDSQSLNYCEDLLESTPTNGTLITHGMVDSYGTHYNQINNNQRKDVEIINLDFLQSASYQKKLIKKGYIIPESENIDVSFFKEFCEKNHNKNIALSLTIPKDYFIPIIDKIYIVGLVFEFHLNSNPSGLIEKNESLWRNKMNKLIIYSNNEKNKNLAANYLPMLLNLRMYFKKIGNNKEVIILDQQIDMISKNCGKDKQVKKLKSSY